MAEISSQEQASDGREITARLTVEELRGEPKRRKAPKVQAIIKVAARTDLGRVRENNEDKFDFFDPDEPELLARRGSLFAVADGMGGHAAGQIASELALKQTLRVYYQDSDQYPADALRAAISEANSLVHDTASALVERSGMGATLTVAVIWGDRLIVGQVGDSRAYLVSREARQVTEDHSWVAEQIRLGALTEADARNSPFRNVITRAVGTSPTVNVDIFEEELREGDTVVLCTDGLHGNVTLEEIAAAASKGPSEAALELVELANERGGNDNITVLIARIAGMGKRRRKTLFGKFRRR